MGKGARKVMDVKPMTPDGIKQYDTKVLRVLYGDNYRFSVEARLIATIDALTKQLEELRPKSRHEWSRASFAPDYEQRINEDGYLETRRKEKP
jgi:hypothetical protein